MAYRGVGAALIGLLVAATSAAAPPAPETPTAATLELRRHFMDRSVNALTFHSIDAIFETRAVKRAPMPIAIPRAERPLAFSYTYAGQTHAAEDVLERTFTNALLVIKAGRIVYERYRNHTRPDTRFL